MKDGISSDPVVVNSSIIFATRKGAVNSVDTASNQMKLLVNLGEAVYGPLTVYDEIVYVHLQDMTLQLVNVATGALLRPISLKHAE